jgi:hypothetical protein
MREAGLSINIFNIYPLGGIIMIGNHMRIRFYPDNSGYFYVYDFSCKNIAHATQKDLQGKNLYDYKDAREILQFVT